MTARLLPDWCCASGCKRCKAWATYSLPIATTDLSEPASAWCDRCRATTYCDAANRCLACQLEAS